MTSRSSALHCHRRAIWLLRSASRCVTCNDLMRAEIRRKRSGTLPSRDTAVEFACPAVFLFQLAVIRALLSLRISLEVGRFAFAPAEFVTSPGLYFTCTAKAEVQLQDETSCCTVVTL